MEAGVSLEWREVVWIVVAVLALYAAMQLGRLQGLRRARPPEPVPATPPAPFGLELEVQQLRRELALLREELEGAGTAWQETSRRLEEEVARLSGELEGLQVERSVSPQYGEAMVLARRGLAADAIAERCGISVAEAALVCSLVQGQQQSGEAQ